MEKESRYKHSKYVVFFMKDEPMTISEVQGLELQNHLLDTNDKFVMIEGVVVAINQITKVEQSYWIGSIPALPEQASMSKEERAKSLERIEKVKIEIRNKIKRIE